MKHKLFLILLFVCTVFCSATKAAANVSGFQTIVVDNENGAPQYTTGGMPGGWGTLTSGQLVGLTQTRAYRGGVAGDIFGDYATYKPNLTTLGAGYYQVKVVSVVSGSPSTIVLKSKQTVGLVKTASGYDITLPDTETWDAVNTVIRLERSTTALVNNTMDDISSIKVLSGKLLITSSMAQLLEVFGIDGTKKCRVVL